jgi:hypothetical protein
VTEIFFLLQNLVGKSERMRALGRPRRTWAFHIEVNPKGILVDFEGFA